MKNIIIVGLTAAICLNAVTMNTILGPVSVSFLPIRNVHFLCSGLLLLIGLYVAYTRDKRRYPAWNNVFALMSEGKGVMDKPSPEQIKNISRLACIGESTVEIIHELRNILVAISGYAQIIGNSEKGHQRVKDFERLLVAVNRFTQTTDNIMEFATGINTRKEKMDLRRIIMNALESKSAACRSDNIEVSTRFPDRSLEVAASEFQLYQVFLNIITNAHYELLKVNRRSFCIKGYIKAGRAIVEFTDNGRGIPKGNLEKVFELFFTTKPYRKGTGVGLSISRKIIEEHGGRLWAESKKGYGATFVLELPLINYEPVVI